MDNGVLVDWWLSDTNIKPLDRTEISASDSGRSGGMQLTNLCTGRWDVAPMEFSDRTLSEWSCWQDVVRVLWSHRSGELEFSTIGVVWGGAWAGLGRIVSSLDRPCWIQWVTVLSSSTWQEAVWFSQGPSSAAAGVAISGPSTWQEVVWFLHGPSTAKAAWQSVTDWFWWDGFPATESTLRQHWEVLRWESFSFFVLRTWLCNWVLRLRTIPLM